MNLRIEVRILAGEPRLGGARKGSANPTLARVKWPFALLGAALLGAALASGTGAAARDASAGTELAARRQALNELLAEQWEYNLRTNPEFASILGDRRWNDK